MNVHPAKREVRFRDPAGVREAVVNAIRRTLESGRKDWQQRFQSPIEPPGAAATTSASKFGHASGRAICSGFGRAGNKNNSGHDADTRD